MRRRDRVRGAILAAGLLAGLAAAPVAAQIDLGRIHHDPVEMLLDLRRQLDLTRSQVSALHQIQRELEAANRPLVREIAAIQREVRTELIQDTSTDDRRGTTASRRRAPSESQIEAARTPMEAIRRNNVAAMERVNALLTELQKKRAAILLRIPERGARPGTGPGV